jgi:hypothetical protein
MAMWILVAINELLMMSAWMFPTINDRLNIGVDLHSNHRAVDDVGLYLYLILREPS